tara:strand:+ start:4886 stop:5164 length:279 start_codon:yes stop_codon:yes gene_type:complete
LKKIDLIKNLSKKTGYSKSYSKKLLEDFLKILTKQIILGNFNLKNVGVFKIIFQNERIGRNPKTKKEYIISSRKTVIFSPSRKIIKSLEKLI